MLDYEQILTQLRLKKIIKILVQFPANVFFRLTPDSLRQIGVTTNSSLFVTSVDQKITLYAINLSEVLGSGDEGTVYSGIDIFTKNSVVIKLSSVFANNLTDAFTHIPIGWKLAKEHLNQYTYFAKTCAFGVVVNVDQSLLPTIQQTASQSDIAQVMEKIAHNFHQVNFTYWSGNKIFQMVTDGLEAVDILHRNSIDGFDPYIGNFLISNEHTLKLCDFNPLVIANDTRPNFIHAIYLLFEIYRDYQYLNNHAIRNQIKSLVALLRLDTGKQLSKNDVLDEVKKLITYCEQRKCIIQCGSESGDITSSNARRTVFCEQVCEAVSYTNDTTTQEGIKHFINPNWGVVSTVAIQSGLVVIATEFLNDSLAYWGAPCWLTASTQQTLNDCWLWSQNSLPTVIAGHLAAKACDYFGINTAIKTTVALTAGVCCNILFRDTTNTATIIATTAASIFGGAVGFWAEKKLVEKLGYSNKIKSRPIALKSL